MNQGRVRGKFLTERTAHQKITCVCNQGHQENFKICPVRGNYSKACIFSGRGVIQETDKKALKGGKPGIAGGDAQRKRDGKISQADGNPVSKTFS